MRSNIRTSRKIAMSLTALAVAAAMAGLATFAAFTATDSEVQTISSGTVELTLADGSVNASFSSGANDMVVGDSFQRLVNVNLAGQVDPSTVSLATEDGAAGASDDTTIFSTATYGLRVHIQKCAGGTWTESASAPWTYTCTGGTATDVLAERDVKTAASSLSGLASGGNSLVVNVTLAGGSADDNTMQNQNASITYTFSVSQRAGTTV